MFAVAEAKQVVGGVLRSMEAQGLEVLDALRCGAGCGAERRCRAGPRQPADVHDPRELARCLRFPASRVTSRGPGLGQYQDRDSKYPPALLGLLKKHPSTTAGRSVGSPRLFPVPESFAGRLFLPQRRIRP